MENESGRFIISMDTISYKIFIVSNIPFGTVRQVPGARPRPRGDGADGAPARRAGRPGVSTRPAGHPTRSTDLVPVARHGHSLDAVFSPAGRGRAGWQPGRTPRTERT